MKNRKSNKKIIITFIAVMVILYAAGYFIGRIAAEAERASGFNEIIKNWKHFLINLLPPVFAAVSAFAVMLPVIKFISCNSMYKELQKDRDNDDLWDTLEEKLNGPMICSNIFSVIEVFLFFSFLYVSLISDYGKNGGYQTVLIIADFVLFLIASVTEVLIPKLVIDIEKKLNPEKEGNLLDFRFHRVWMDSSDEAQKLIAYKAGYQAFLNTNIVCVVMCTVSLIVMFLFKTGVYPLLCVCVIWLVNNVSYMFRAVRLERRTK